MISYLFLLLLVNTQVVLMYNLTPNQWTSIRHILQHPESSLNLKQKVKTILYKKYESWAKTQAYIFKKKHRYLCNHIQANELEIYALQGLHKAIENYNPMYSFQSFLALYLRGYLFKGTTILQPMTTIPKYKRLYKKWSMYRKQNRKKITPILLTPEDHWQFEKRQPEEYNTLMIDSISKKYDVEDIWRKLDMLPSSRDKLIFNYKYQENNNPPRSNKEVADLMCLSEETIRQSIKQTKRFLQE